MLVIKPYCLYQPVLYCRPEDGVCVGSNSPKPLDIGVSRTVCEMWKGDGQGLDLYVATMSLLASCRLNTDG